MSTRAPDARISRPRVTPLRIAGGALAAIVVAGLTAAAYLPNNRAMLLRHVEHARLLTADHWLAFGLGQMVIAASGILPASAMAVMAGAAYGFGPGFLLSIAWTMLGGWIAFALSRSMLRPWIARLMGRRSATARFDQALEGEGWRFVFLLRISPVMPFALTSYGLGLTRIRQRDYLLGTLASLPAMASYVALGAMGRHGLSLGLSRGDPVQWMLLGIGVLAMLVLILRTKAIVQQITGTPAETMEAPAE